MQNYIIRRLMQAAFVLILLTLIVFMLVRLLPGDPLYIYYDINELMRLNEEEIAELRAKHGLDENWFVQYGRWISDVVRGDLRDAEQVRQATAGAGAVVHLAAVLPPAAEQDRAHTLAVNVDGTRHLAEAMAESSPGAPFVFASSVHTYGDTSRETAPVEADHPQSARDRYSESKIAAERVLREISPAAVILRISGVALPDVYEPPEIWERDNLWLNCKNTMLHLETLETRPHSPDFFSKIQIPCNWDPKASYLEIEDTLCQIHEDNPEKVQVLKEFFGYCIYPRLIFPCAIFQIGDGRTGKSLVTDLLVGMLGDEI